MKSFVLGLATLLLIDGALSASLAVSSAIQDEEASNPGAAAQLEPTRQEQAEPAIVPVDANTQNSGVIPGGIPGGIPGDPRPLGPLPLQPMPAVLPPQFSQPVDIPAQPPTVPGAPVQPGSGSGQFFPGQMLPAANFPGGQFLGPLPNQFPGMVQGQQGPIPGQQGSFGSGQPGEAGSSTNTDGTTSPAQPQFPQGQFPFQRFPMPQMFPGQFPGVMPGYPNNPNQPNRPFSSTTNADGTTNPGEPNSQPSQPGQPNQWPTQWPGGPFGLRPFQSQYFPSYPFPNQGNPGLPNQNQNQPNAAGQGTAPTDGSTDGTNQGSGTGNPQQIQPGFPQMGGGFPQPQLPFQFGGFSQFGPRPQLGFGSQPVGFSPPSANGFGTLGGATFSRPASVGFSPAPMMNRLPVFG